MKCNVIMLVVGTALLLGACGESRKPSSAPAANDEQPVEKFLGDSLQNSDKVKQVAEDMKFHDVPTPEFQGGFEAMRAYIKKHLRMPEAARKSKLEGCVVVLASINEHGNLTNASILMSDDDVFNDEALRLVRSMPRFLPARKAGKPIAADMKIQVMFRH